MQDWKLLPQSDLWGVVNFKKLPRAIAFARVFLFIAVALAISYFSMVSNSQNFALDILTKLDCLLAIILLYSEGVHVKQWLLDRFTWPKNKKAFFVGFFLTILPVIAASVGHRLFFGQFPTMEKLPFSGHIFGYFLMNLFLVTFEDISWRAFLIPRVLHLLPFFGSIVGIGVLWGVWHIPFHLTLNLITPDQIVTQIAYYTCVYTLYYIVWRLSEGSLLPLTITHAFYNTIGHFTTENIFFLEGSSDAWVFYYFQLVALGILVSITAISLTSLKSGPKLD